MREGLSGWIDVATWGEVLVSGGWLLGAILVGLALHTILFWILGRLARRTPTPWDEKALARTRNPSRLLFPLFVVNLVVPHLALPPRGLALLDHATTLLLIASVAYLLIGLVFLLRDVLLSRHDIQVADNLAARKVHTQIKVLENVLISVVAVATVAFMLITFEGVRQVGVSILASAGIAGIILGLAAQKSIGTLLAGIQIAITQPIRVDDVVIVEGEWGWIEEITLTFVVVRVWDLRRLVVPITHFIESPFQNWTRVSADILGTVLLYTDYTIPVEAIRQELHRIVEESELWDGRVCGLQVTDCRPDVLELRLLISAEDSGKAWNLRCHLREKMVAFIQEKYPESLPRVRAELGGPALSQELVPERAGGS